MSGINNPNVLKIKMNNTGRDFVVGDLHGCYDDLMGLLSFVNFNPKTDRLFCTGDLIDRGPKSLECLNLLTKEWFFSVLGNHELLFLQKSILIESGQADLLPNAEKTLIQKGLMYAEYIKNLPILYELDNPIHGSVYIIHAEILPEHIFNAQGYNFESNNYNKLLELMNKIDLSKQILFFIEYLKLNKDIDTNMPQKLIWSRKLIQQFYSKHREKIDNNDFSFIANEKINQKIKIFCGHNVVPFPLKIGQQYYIDTGAALGYTINDTNNDIFTQFKTDFFSLSIVDINTGLSYSSITSQSDRKKIMKLKTNLYD